MLQATVTFVESLGGATFAYCAFPGVEDALTCEFDGRARVRSGDSLSLHIPPEAAYLFDAEGKAFRRLGAQPGKRAAGRGGLSKQLGIALTLAIGLSAAALAQGEV